MKAAGTKKKKEKNMKKIREFFSDLSGTVTLTRREGVLIVAVGALVGMIFGMLCSPRKHLTCGCGNGTTTNHFWGGEDVCFDEEEQK